MSLETLPVDDLSGQRTHADLRDFLRGVVVITHTGAQAEQLLRDVFQDRQVQQDAFAALAAGDLQLLPLH